MHAMFFHFSCPLGTMARIFHLFVSPFLGLTPPLSMAFHWKHVSEWVSECLLNGLVASLYQWAASFNIVIYEVFAYWEPQNSYPIRVRTGQEVRGQLEIAYPLLTYLSKFFPTSLTSCWLSRVKLEG